MACRTVRAKRELVRVVRSPAGDLAVDLRGKAPGRGAYLCPEAERACLERGIESGVLVTALGTPIDRTAIASLATALREAAQVRNRKS